MGEWSEDEWEKYPAYPLSAKPFGGVDPQGERVYAIKEAVEASGLSEKLIRRLINEGVLPIVELPGERRTMVRRYDLDTYIQSHRVRKKRPDEKS